MIGWDKEGRGGKKRGIVEKCNLSGMMRDHGMGEYIIVCSWMEKQLALARLGFERERGLYTEGRLEIMFPCVYPGHGHSVYA